MSIQQFVKEYSILNREYREHRNGRTEMRKRSSEGTWTEWAETAAESAPSEADAGTGPCHLYVITQSQAAGEPKHWALFAAREGRPGRVYQVKGDAEHMRHMHARNVDVTRSASFLTSYELCVLSGPAMDRVDHWAHAVAAPRAENRAAVRRNCQTWVIDVLRRLVDEGIVPAEQVDKIGEMIEPSG